MKKSKFQEKKFDNIVMKNCDFIMASSQVCKQNRMNNTAFLKHRKEKHGFNKIGKCHSTVFCLYFAKN